MDDELSVASKMKVDFYLIFQPPKVLLFFNSIFGYKCGI